MLQNLEKMLTDDDRKHIERQTGVALNNEQGMSHTVWVIPLLNNNPGHSDVKESPGDVLFNILQRVLQQENNTEIRNFYRQQILK